MKAILAVGLFLAILGAVFFLQGSPTPPSPIAPENAALLVSEASSSRPPMETAQSNLEAPAGSAPEEPPSAPRSAEASREEAGAVGPAGREEAAARLKGLFELSVQSGLDPNGIVESALEILEEGEPNLHGVYSTTGDSLGYPLRGLPKGFEGTFSIRSKRASEPRTLDVFVIFRFPAPVWLEGIPREGSLTLSLTSPDGGRWEPDRFFLGVILDADLRTAELHGIETEGKKFLGGLAYWMLPGGEVAHKRIFMGERESAEDPNPLIGRPELSERNWKRLVETVVKFARAAKPEEFK